MVFMWFVELLQIVDADTCVRQAVIQTWCQSFSFKLFRKPIFRVLSESLISMMTLQTTMSR
jgi:hypothetical protein